MSHYFIEDPTLIKNPKIITFLIDDKKIMVKSDKGTFSKYRVDLGTSIFISSLITLPLNGDILDLGSGNGIVGISIKTIFQDKVNVTYADINPYCVNLTNESLKLNNMVANVYLSDGFADIKDESFDFILLNSPISAGKKVCFRLYSESKSKMKKESRLIIVIRKDKGALSHLDYLKTLYTKVEIINKEKGYFIISSSI